MTKIHTIGKTENDLLIPGFKAAYMFRPGLLQPIKGLKNTYTIYKVVSPLFPLLNTLMPKYVCTLENLGLSMVNVTLKQPEIRVLKNKEIKEFAQ